MPVSDQAFVTLATNDVYCQGALVLGQSLRNQGATRKLVVLVTPQVSRLLRLILSKVFDEVVNVDLIDSADYVHLAFLRRPELGVTLTKLHCWTLTQYRKCVFLDADTLVLSNVDELFERGELSAAPDPGWPDCFNSGVFVFQPSLETHSRLLRHVTEHGSFDGADQGVLNTFFGSWPTADIRKHLPFIYNLSSNTAYTYRPAFKQFGSRAKVVHFLGSAKPWESVCNPQTGSVSEEGSESAHRHQLSFLNLWWDIFHHSILPLYGSVRAAEGREAATHTASVGGSEVPWANAAPGAEGQCVNSAAGASRPWPREDTVEPPLVASGAPPSPERGHSEDRSTCTPATQMIGEPDAEASTRVTSDLVCAPGPRSTDSPQTPGTSYPADHAGGGPSDAPAELSPEPPADVPRDPGVQEALEVTIQSFACSGLLLGALCYVTLISSHTLSSSRVCLPLPGPLVLVSSPQRWPGWLVAFLSRPLIITPFLPLKVVWRKFIAVKQQCCVFLESEQARKPMPTDPWSETTPCLTAGG